MKCTLFFFKPLTSRQNDENYLIVLTDKDLGYRNKICDKKKTFKLFFRNWTFWTFFMANLPLKIWWHLPTSRTLWRFLVLAPWQNGKQSFLCRVVRIRFLTCFDNFGQVPQRTHRPGSLETIQASLWYTGFTSMHSLSLPCKSL